MIRWLLRTIFGCAHEHRYRRIVDRELYLVCDRCFHAKPAITREAGFVRSGRQVGHDRRRLTNNKRNIR